MNKRGIYLAVFVSTLFTSNLLKAQTDKVKFGAVSRTFLESDKLKSNDTVNVGNIKSGYSLLDLGLNINPDKNTEIQSVIRFKTDLGGFYGAGTLIEIRQLRVRGIIAKFLNYELGDLHMQLSPYTLYNSAAEGQINESQAFSDLRNDIAYYDNRNNGNRWWQQGAHADFGLVFDKSYLQSLKVDGFFLRNRPLNFIGGSNVFYGGGKLTLNQSKYLTIAGNYINLYDDGATANTKKESQNPVMTAEAMFKLDKDNYLLKVMGEIGASQLNVSQDPSLNTNSFKDTSSSIKGNFFDGAVGIDLKPSKLSFKAGYNYVGADFFSSGAQTKRVDFSKTPQLFYGATNDKVHNRQINLFDLTRDVSVYNSSISRQLMPYNPIFSNALPYGKATPNRKGITLEGAYKDSLEKVIVNVSSAFLSDISGEGTLNHKQFTVLKGEVTLNINKFFDFSKALVLTAGTMYESTNRAGDLASVNLKGMLMDFGAQVEVAKKLDLLGGVKLFNSKGNEYYVSRDVNNQITAFTPFNVDQSQTLIGYGLKFRFSKFSYISLQNQMFSFNSSINSNLNYSFDQLYFMFNMKL
jgi:hypothetical protein